MLIRKGNTARAAGRWRDAREAYAEALERRPGLAPIWVQYGHMLREEGSFPEALAAYRRADSLQRDQADTHLQLGRTLALLGQFVLALRHLDRSIVLADGPSDGDRERQALLDRLRHRSRRPCPRPSNRPPRPPGMPGQLRNVVFGTTGTCNASCVHCPTGKPETAHVPRGTMPLDRFRAIIDGIVAYDLPVTGQIAFGLFGDGLLDPLVVERAEYVRARLPDVHLSVNTNGAAFSRAKHAPLDFLADTVALHCESVQEDTYDTLMRPLRWERVRGKAEEMLRSFPGKVRVSVPVSTRNRDELPAIRRWFEERGAREVAFEALSSRCAENRTGFDELALNPRPIRCPPAVLEDLIADCDGQVLVCCQDFRRVESVGDAASSFAGIFASARRHAVRALLAGGQHEALQSCKHCHADLRNQHAPA